MKGYKNMFLKKITLFSLLLVSCGATYSQDTHDLRPPISDGSYRYAGPLTISKQDMKNQIVAVLSDVPYLSSIIEQLKGYFTNSLTETQWDNVKRKSHVDQGNIHYNILNEMVVYKGTLNEDNIATFIPNENQHKLARHSLYKYKAFRNKYPTFY